MICLLTLYAHVMSSQAHRQPRGLVWLLLHCTFYTAWQTTPDEAEIWWVIRSIRAETDSNRLCIPNFINTTTSVTRCWPAGSARGEGVASPCWSVGRSVRPILQTKIICHLPDFKTQEYQVIVVNHFLTGKKYDIKEFIDCLSTCLC